MTPSARLSAAIEVLDDTLARRRPAADALKDWGLSHRFAGSGDRAAIGGLVYDALRRKASSAWIMGEDTPRAILLGMLKRERGLDAEAIARLADGGRFAPPPLSEAERARLSEGKPCRCPAACRWRLSRMARRAIRAGLRRRACGGGCRSRVTRAARSSGQHAEGRARQGVGLACRAAAAADALVACWLAHRARRRRQGAADPRRACLHQGP